MRQLNLMEPLVVNVCWPNTRPRVTHYIGRPGIFGNPYVLGKDGGREQVISKFERYARSNSALLTAIRNIPQNAVLGCYCKPEDCHGDVIVKIWKELNHATQDQ